MNDAEFTLVKRRLQALTGIDLECYKSPQVRRRLESYLARVRAPSWPAYLNQLAKDPQAVRQLRDYLTINVSSFFRDVGKWEELRRIYLPELRNGGDMIRAWSAGCSIGAEPYSLAILLQEMPGQARHVDGTKGRFNVYATDIDRAILQQARAGGPYGADLLKDVSPAWLSRYFRRQDAAYWVTPALREKVEFAEMDLLNIRVRAGFDLILCRNVLIYFTDSAKRRVIEGLTRALRPGGILFIGSTESISYGRDTGLERAGISFYRRVA